MLRCTMCCRCFVAVVAQGKDARFVVLWSRSGTNAKMNDLLPLPWCRSVPQRENVGLVWPLIWCPNGKMSDLLMSHSFEVVHQCYSGLEVVCQCWNYRLIAVTFVLKW